MVELFTGVVMLWFGLWLIKRRGSSTNSEVQAELKRLKNFQNKAFEAQDHAILMQARALEAAKIAEQFSELRQQVADDAVSREARAKAALISVLKSDGCSDAQIQGVLEKIDSPEK